MQYDMAPLEGITTYLYRNAHTHCFGGVARYYTPFISPHRDKTLNHKELMDVCPEHNEGLCVIPQILTASAEDFLKTAKELAAMGYTQVNLNCGCPSGTVTSKHKGAGILDDTVYLERFLTEIFEHSPLQISVKTRIGISEDYEWEDILAVYARFPMSELIIHPRVRQDFYRGEPRPGAVRQALDVLDCPITYNGNIFTKKDVERIAELFPEISACMLGRGLIANPALAMELQGGAPMTKEQLAAFHEELLAGYCEQMADAHNAMHRMKELWFYMGRMFTNSERYCKQIRKAQRLADYRSAVAALFREQELIPMEERHFIF